MAESTNTYGLLAQFKDADALLEAARKVRDAGYSRWDTFTPFPVHGMEQAMGLRDSKLPYLTLLAGMTGTGVAILMQWWMNAVDYPIVISGKPLFSLPANIPVAFEVTVLFASLATVAGLFLLSDLPRLYHPTFRSRRFRSVTTDGFFLCIESADSRFDSRQTAEFLKSLHCTHLEPLED